MANDQDGRTTGNGRLLDRRTMLKATGVSALAAFGVGTASAASYNTFVIDAKSTNCEYRIEFSGQAAPVEDTAATADAIGDGVIEGSVSDGVAAYRITDQVTSLSIDGSAGVEYGADAEDALPEAGHDIVIESDTRVDYSLTTTGEITKRFDAGKYSAEERNDSVSQNDDGTWTAAGLTGNGYGDSYTFRGEVVDFTPLDGDVTITVDGSETSTYDLAGEDAPESHKFVIASPTRVDYEFEADGQIEKRLDAGDLSAEEANDSVTENGDGTWTAAGMTGNGYGDSYRVAGAVTSFSPLDGDVVLKVDGQEVDPYELTGTERPSQQDTDSSSGSGDSVVGGGDGYQNTVSPDQADVTVSSKSQLASALKSASSGDVVYVSGDADIQMGSSQLTVPSGVTLASDRGIDGAAGGRLSTGQNSWPMLSVQSDARVTGLRVSGPHDSYMDYDSNAVGMGVRAKGSGVEFDNNEIHGFSHAAVRAVEDTHVHHNYIHHNPMDGLGYGVSVTGSGHPVIEYNRMDFNRHSVANSGKAGYTVAHNHFGPNAIDHVIDCHRPGGKTLEIHHNTVEATSHVQDNGSPEAVALRGAPDDVARIEANWFHNSNEPKSSPDGWDGSAITQVHTSGWQNVDYSGNHYGTDEPSSDVGCPR